MKDKQITRRMLLKMLGGASAATLIAACTPATPAAPATQAPAPTQAPKVDPTKEPAKPAATTAPTTAPTAAPTKEAAKPVSGRTKELRLMTTLNPISTLDSYLYTPGMYTQCMLGLKEGLVEFGKDMNPVAGQAEKWQIAPDGLEYTFSLRKDNKWYDGTPVTAKDYVAAIHYQLTPGKDSKWGWDTPFAALVNASEYNAGAAKVEDVGVQAVDDYTLKFKLRQLRPDFLNALVTGSCYPIHAGALAKFGDKWMSVENFQGNGPYKIEKWVENQYISVVPNPNYNRERGNLERVTYKFAGKPLEAYQADEIDTVAGLNSLSVADVVVIKKDSKLAKELVIYDTGGLEWLAPLKCEGSWLWDHQAVLTAITKAVDVKAVVDPIWLGAKKVVNQLNYPLQPDFDASLNDILKPNVAEAQKILADAGFPGGKGVPKLKLVFPAYQNQDYISAWTAIADEIKQKLGITIELANTEYGVYAQVVYDALNKPEWEGLGFYASGAPWQDPTFGLQGWWQVWDYKDAKTQNGYGTLNHEQTAISKGDKKIDGGSDADFDAVIKQIGTLRDATLAAHDKNNAAKTMRADAEKMYKGWIDQVTKLAADAKAGDRAAKWKDANFALWGAKADNYMVTNRPAIAWQQLQLLAEANATTDAAKIKQLSRQSQEMRLKAAAYLPLWLSQSPTLVKPYVQGFACNPFWWGSPSYAKWVSIV